MQLTLEIPDVVFVSKMTNEADLIREVKREFALSLYGRGMLSAGKAAEYGELTRREFEKLLGERRIERPLTAADLDQEFEGAASK